MSHFPTKAEIETLWRKYVMLAYSEGTRGGVEIPYQDIRDLGELLDELKRIRVRQDVQAYQWSPARLHAELRGQPIHRSRRWHTTPMITENGDGS